MRIKIIRTNKKYSKGEVVDVSKNVAFGLIDSGLGIISKDIDSLDLERKPNRGYNRGYEKKHTN